MAKTVALIASLDTKHDETLYAARTIRELGADSYIIDVSTYHLVDGADITPPEILRKLEDPIEWNDFRTLGKAGCIQTMSSAMAEVLPKLYREGKFDGVISIGGGQNAMMAATAMKALPFGVPKIVASSLACGKRTMEQYVGNKDIFVMHTVADVSGLNAITKTVIRNVCSAAVGMVQNNCIYQPEAGKKVLGATMLGITTKGTEAAIREINRSGKYESVVFHANGVGGRCLEDLIREGKIDVVLDMTLHEIDGEILGCYCSGAEHRLETAVRYHIPMVVVPGALDMVDYFKDEEGNGLPADIDKRRKVWHNQQICHCKIYRDEAVKLVDVVCGRLNQATSPVTLIVPTKGCCEAAAPGGKMYDPEVDAVMVDEFRKKVGSNVKLIVVDANINDPKFSETVAQEVLLIDHD